MVIIVILLILGLVYGAIKSSPIETKSHWQHTFNNFQFSSMEFYRCVEESIKRHQIPDVTFTKVNHFQSGIFSSKREYLRISRNEYIFDICAAPFGNDFFVSWWLGESVRNIIARIPIINTLTGRNRKNKSYYQLDTESMFQSSIHQGLLEAIDQITTTKGLRSLSESERVPINVK